MWTTLYVLILFVLNLLKVNSQDYDLSYYETTTSKKLAEGEKKLSESIRKALEHFKKPDPEGLPGLEVPDPYSVPDMKQTIGFGTNLIFTDTMLHGISKFRVLYIKSEIQDMECRASLAIDSLQIHGRYTLNMWLSSYKGAFTANVTGIKTTAISTLGIELDGKLTAQNISININFENINVNFENAGILTTMISGVFNSIGTFLFDSIKPVLLRDAQTNMRQEINNKLDQVVGDIKFPNTISPIDSIIVDARKKLREMKMDPFKIDDYNISKSIFKIHLSDTWITGLSSLYRIGNISLYLQNNTVLADFSIGTQELKGFTQWKIDAFGGLIYRSGSVSFSVTYIQTRLLLSQSLDTRNKMEFKEMDIEMGNIQLHFDGAGTLDYILELSANILPNLLRYQIIETIKSPMKSKIQQELDEIDVEEMILNELPNIDKIQEDGFQLSSLRIINITEEKYDDDEFFNF